LPEIGARPIDAANAIPGQRLTRGSLARGKQTPQKLPHEHGFGLCRPERQTSQKAAAPLVGALTRV